MSPAATDTEARKETFRRLIEEADGKNGDVSLLAELVHEDIVLPEDHLVPPGTPPEESLGLQGLKVHMEYVPSMTESQSEVQEMLVDGDKIVARVIVRGKQVGDFLGIPSSGREFEMGGIIIAEFRENKVAQIWRCMDLLGMALQLADEPSWADN